MPFINETEEPDIETLARKSFYNQFSSKNYVDIEMAHVDKGLKMLSENNAIDWKDLGPSVIGDHLHSDFIIYGKVKEFTKVFLGIYSQLSLNISIEMVETKNGEIIWKRETTRRSHEGGLPFNPFGIIPAALRSGLHLKKEKTIELVDKVNRELIEQLPEPSLSPFNPYFIEIQVASFLEKERAEMVVKKLKTEGLNTSIHQVKLGDKQWYRVMIGPFYDLPAAEEIKDRITRDFEFEPIFIHHYAEVSDKGGGNDKDE